MTTREILAELYERLKEEVQTTNERIKQFPDDEYFVGRRSGQEDGLYWLHRYMTQEKEKEAQVSP
jgi:hypothetical protein